MASEKWTLSEGLWVWFLPELYLPPRHCKREIEKKVYLNSKAPHVRMHIDDRMKLSTTPAEGDAILGLNGSEVVGTSEELSEEAE